MKRLALMVVGAGAAAIAFAACDKKHASNACSFFSNGSGATAQFHLDSSCPTNPFPSDVMRSGDTVTIPPERVAYVMPDSATFDIARDYLKKTSESLDADG